MKPELEIWKQYGLHVCLESKVDHVNHATKSGTDAESGHQMTIGQGIIISLRCQLTAQVIWLPGEL